MTTARTSALIERMPRWFSDQARSLADQAERRRDVLAERAKLEFLFAVEVMDSGWGDWEDTVAAFAHSTRSRA